jgi:hypothetical protein
MKGMSFGDQRDQRRLLSGKLWAHPWLRFMALTIYYLGILIALFAIYSRWNFSTPPFIYQNF